MVGGFGMDDRNRSYNQIILEGCGVVTLVVVMVLVGSLIHFFNLDRKEAQYPGSVPISSHSNYRGLPFEFRWDDAYQTSDNFIKVYNWYSVTFDLGAEARAFGKCIVLDRAHGQWSVERHMNVSLCNTPAGQLIYVTRFTTFSGRSSLMTGIRELQSLIATN